MKPGATIRDVLGATENLHAVLPSFQRYARRYAVIDPVGSSEILDALDLALQQLDKIYASALFQRALKSAEAEVWLSRQLASLNPEGGV